MEIAYESSSKLIGPADLAFLIRAVNDQIEQHWAPAYQEEAWPCRAYASLQGLKAGTFWPIAIMDDIDQPGALGFHSWLAGLSYGRVTASKDPRDGTTPSHEGLELRGDADCNIWIPMGDGRFIAYEMCDPCEGDTYAIPVTIGDETRSILVSDFATPNYWVAGAPRPYSYLDTIDVPFGLSRNGGGYRLIKDATGKVSSDFGDGASLAMTMKMAKKIANPRSRTARRGLRG